MILFIIVSIYLRSRWKHAAFMTKLETLSLSDDYGDKNSFQSVLSIVHSETSGRGIRTTFMVSDLNAETLNSIISPVFREGTRP